MLDLPDDWVWDFWTTHDGERHHAFFLCAPRSLGDPDLRHVNARVGHATSADLVTWEVLDDALRPQPEPAFDDLATWTGSVVRDDDGTWWLFTSGIDRADGGLVQRVGSATSRDLRTWTRTDLVLEADPRWYDVRDPGVPGSETHWRDPFVVRGDDGTWHLYLTAKAGGRRGGGVVGHAVSTDLRRWEVRPPLTAPSGRFDQLEVVSLAQVDGAWVALFSCLAPEMPGAAPGGGGVWSVAAAAPGEPFDVTPATRLTDETRYVGRVVPAASGPALMAFVNQDAEGRFVGGLTDPRPVRWRADGAGLENVCDEGPTSLPGTPAAH